MFVQVCPDEKWARQQKHVGCFYSFQYNMREIPNNNNTSYYPFRVRLSY